jgi:hypothetical protein
VKGSTDMYGAGIPLDVSRSRLSSTQRLMRTAAEMIFVKLSNTRAS